jgi:hypothetical protein
MKKFQLITKDKPETYSVYECQSCWALVNNTNEHAKICNPGLTENTAVKQYEWPKCPICNRYLNRTIKDDTIIKEWCDYCAYEISFHRVESTHKAQNQKRTQ